MCGASIVHYCVLLCQIASFRLGFFLYLSSIKISIWHYKQPDWNFSTWVWISPRMIKYCWWNKSWATLLVLHLLVRIYHKGCLCCWREDRCLLFTRRLSEGCTADYVQQVVDALLERGFLVKPNTKKWNSYFGKYTGPLLWGGTTTEVCRGEYWLLVDRDFKIQEFVCGW